ncbi:MAG: anaerobic sulfatase maturase [Oscillospiraceae bacterium]|jgi:uncharacterized protein|nr:anaerobic sulfatase maturase [Oscillospiraceae bacterium]
MPPLSILIKPASSACNLRCRYCFYQKPARAFMALETLEQLVQTALQSAEGSCTFAFQGGEPTLVGLEFYRALLAFQQKYNSKKLKIENTIQTNGVLLDDDWAAFLAASDFLVGLSLDGPRKFNDANRVHQDNTGSFDAIMQAAARLKKHGAPFNILSVVTAQAARQPEEIYAFFKKKGYDFLQFIPALNECPGHHNLKPGQYGNFLCRVFDLWYQDFARGEKIDVRFFANLVQMAAGYAPEACGMCGRCTPYPVVEADGSVYPCDFYVTEEWKLGTVCVDLNTLLQSEKARQFAAPSLLMQEDCRACPHAFLCRGGCRRWREPLPGKSLLCEDYRRFFAHCGGRIAEMAHKYLR